MATQTDLHASFDPARLGNFTGTIDTAPISISTAGDYLHLVTGYTTNLTATLNTQITGGGGTATVAFSAANLQYTISKGSNFTIAYGSVLGTLLGNPTFGGTIGGPLTGHNAYTSSIRPLYVIRPLIAGRSQYSDDYEQDGRVRQSVSDDGSTYTISPVSLPICVDWTFPYENKTPLSGGGTYVGGSGHAVRTRDVTSTMTWSWEQLYQYARQYAPLVAWCSQTSPPSSATADVFRMRAETLAFKPLQAAPDYDALWSLPFKTFLVGRQ